MHVLRLTLTAIVFLYSGELFWQTATIRAADDVPLQNLDPRMHHLRIDGPPEWAEFPEHAEGAALKITFKAAENDSPTTLRLRQQDVKQSWEVSINDTKLGRLHRDENDMVVYFNVPKGTLDDGENTLRVEPVGRGRSRPDDIRVGEVVLDRRPMKAVLFEGVIEIDVIDADSGEHIPARITVVNTDGALQTTSAQSDHHLAVRPGTVYTSDGKARFGLPAGEYTIYAGRGFEYSLDQVNVTVPASVPDTRSVRDTATTLSIRREVPTDDYVACDTHIHTLTHSGHGDATVEERMITLAAEGIELPIATDHNVHINHDPYARKLNVRRYFTPVIGNEVTTSVGHFNIFPVEDGAPTPDYKLTDWESILAEIYRTPDVKIAILNHGRDLHGGTRPLGPKLHNAVVGENVEGWSWRANAMEVINSGATQTDVMQLIRDWMGLLNRGRIITPVGSSDSHDVGRHFVGQGRTYIRCNDHDPGQIAVEQAVNNFLQGRVLVSYGLLTDVTVQDKYGPGELVPVFDDAVKVSVRVLGPHWVNATKVELYANGQKIREATINDRAQSPRPPSPPSQGGGHPPGVKWTGTWTIERPKHDVHLVAVALGPGIDGPYWKTAKPYQPGSPHWKPHVIGCTGAIWLDVDGDGRKTPAYDYARRIVNTILPPAPSSSRSRPPDGTLKDLQRQNRIQGPAEPAGPTGKGDAGGGDLPKLLERLAGYDEAVAAQAAHLFHSRGRSLRSPKAQQALKKATPAVQAGFRAHLDAWRKTQIARSTP